MPPLVVAALGHRIVALERATGRRIWEWQDKDGTDFSHIAVDGAHVLVGGGTRLVCLAYATGAVMWSVSVPVPVSTWLVDGPHVFLGSGGEVACLDRETGRALWHDPFPGYGLSHVALGVAGAASNVDKF
jgi:outer membrane protein assembly factor BamB